MTNVANWASCVWKCHILTLSSTYEVAVWLYISVSVIYVGVIISIRQKGEPDL